MYRLTDYHYTLPEELIAAVPSPERDGSRLLTMDRKTGTLAHHVFSDIGTMIEASDLIVLNNTKVIPARLYGRKDTGGKVEILILNYEEGQRYLRKTGSFESACLVKASIAPKIGSTLYFDEGVSATVTAIKNGVPTLSFHSADPFEAVLDRIGHMPLPPYIRRDETQRAWDDRTSYQTVYARNKGAVAAPTAGLHFTESLIETLRKKGTAIAYVTLHVGYGTFVPVRAKDIRDHAIHREWYTIPEETARLVNQYKEKGKSVLAVGTTSVRTLEYAADAHGRVQSGSGECDLFIYPGYLFKVVDKMITNFHLPQSTLLMLVSAFAGLESILHAYTAAIENNYRFFSYGDAMLIT